MMGGLLAASGEGFEQVTDRLRSLNFEEVKMPNPELLP